MRRIAKSKATRFFLAFLLFVYLNNSSFFVPRKDGKPLLLAHRGLGQTFPMEGITGETNTARIIYEPEHPYLENTIPSMEAAFRAGADIVEFDVHPTKDGQFAVFHDWILDYRTDGQGVTREHTLAELKKLDIGYGYTADGGKTYPFRGKGVGCMPSLQEVLDYFPGRSFLIHIKSDDPQEGELMADFLQALPEERLARLTVYGGDRPVALLKERLPQLRVMSMATLKRALLSYALLGWTGYIPPAIRGTQLHLPLKYARYLWGWPHRFLSRMEAVDTRVILVLGDGKWSEGFDRVEDLQQLPVHYTGGIWTNRIDRIGPVFAERSRQPDMRPEEQ
ncbi:MAG: glycerophosphodiester phosphodiesterase [Firmicutes bacterium]|nr:glycerophosphodiester phosphodiesterase [Bacillota bacterium]